MTTISNTIAFKNLGNTGDHRVVCDVCQVSLILKTEDEKDKDWWHNCINDIFYGMAKINLIRFSGENRE